MKLELVSYCKFRLVVILLILLPQVIFASSRRFDPETDRLVKERFLSMEAEIDVRYSDEVRDRIFYYVEKHKNASAQILGRLPMYLPIFTDIVREKQMPEELVYLPIVESSLFPEAVSKVGATGLWQFMRPTAQLMGLKMTKNVDERRDPIKSTEAAMDYLKHLYKIYGSWGTVLAAYNSGTGTVNKAIRRAGNKKNYWAIRQYLPRETQQYVPRFLAILYVVNHYKDHGIVPRVPGDDMVHTSIARVKGHINLNELAKDMGVEREILLKLNPGYIRGYVPGNGNEHYIIIPHNKLGVYIEKYGSGEDIVKINSSFATNFDDLSIAYRTTDDTERSEISIPELPSGEEDNDFPTRDNGADMYLKNASIINDRTYKYIRLTNGQSLRQIAENYGVELAVLLDENNYSTSNLPRLGDLVKIPM